MHQQNQSTVLNSVMLLIVCLCIFCTLVGEPYVLDHVKGMRSKIECATYCYDNPYCRTAVFKRNSSCLLVRNYTVHMELNYSPSDQQTDDIIALRNFSTTSVVWLSLIANN